MVLYLAFSQVPQLSHKATFLVLRVEPTLLFESKRERESSSGEQLRYQRRCNLSNRGDADNFPVERARAQQHFKNVQAMASQSRLNDISAMKNVEAIGWAEDVCGGTGYKITRLKLVDKYYNVRTILFDISHADEKYAVSKLEQAKKSITEFFSGDEQLMKSFCSKVKAGCKVQICFGRLEVALVESWHKGSCDVETGMVRGW